MDKKLLKKSNKITKIVFLFIVLLLLIALGFILVNYKNSELKNPFSSNNKEDTGLNLSKKGEAEEKIENTEKEIEETQKAWEEKDEREESEILEEPVSFLPWKEAIERVKIDGMIELFQQNDFNVKFTTTKGDKFITQESKIDDYKKLIKVCGDNCKDIVVISE